MPDTDDLLAQSSALHDWLVELPDALWAQPSVLPGYDVRTLVGHLLLVHVGLLRCLDRPTTERPVAKAEFVTRYRRDVDDLEAATREVAADRSPAELRAALAEARMTLAALLSGELPRVIESPRGPTTTTDFLVTRIVELVVHADDLSRSFSEREPVPIGRRPLATAVRALAEILAAQAPGRSVEVRVPPFVAVQAIAGPRHTRGTPPNVVESEPLVWLRLATGRLAFRDAVAAGDVRASGGRADLTPYLPVLS